MLPGMTFEVEASDVVAFEVQASEEKASEVEAVVIVEAEVGSGTVREESRARFTDDQITQPQIVMTDMRSITARDLTETQATVLHQHMLEARM